MKKIIILMLLMLSTIPFVHLRAEIVTQPYDLTYTHGYWYDLYDGNFEANPNFSITNRNKILKGSLILDDLTSFHHLIFFDKNNQMIGYMNTALTELETPLFIDNINSFTPDIPTNAVYFALMGFYPYLNNTPIPEINNLTLGQIFGGTYDLSNYYNLYYDDDYLDVSIAELNNHTLREVFEGGQLFLNSDLTSLTNWSFIGSAHTLSSGKITFTGDGVTTRISIYQAIVGTNGNKYYLGSYVSSNITNTSVGLLYYGNQLGGIKSIDKISTEKWNSAIVTWATGYNNNAFAMDWRDGTLLSGNYVTVRKPLLLNMTSLGISSLTVSQMDYWFALYQSIKINSITQSNGVTTPDNINYYYYNDDYGVIYSLYQLQDDSVHSPIYGDTFDALSSVQKLAQMNRWAQYPHELLDFADLNWFPTQTELTNYYTLFQNNILFDDYYFDDIEITITQPIVSYSYDRDVDNRGIVDYINDFMDDLGIGNPMAKFSISLILIVIVMVILWLVKAPSLLVIMGGLLMLIMFIIFGWVPIYIIVIVSAVLFYLIATNKGGNQDA